MRVCQCSGKTTVVGSGLVKGRGRKSCQLRMKSVNRPQCERCPNVMPISCSYSKQHHLFCAYFRSFIRCGQDFSPPKTHIMQSCFLNPICLCQRHSSKSASPYEGNCFLLSDDLSLAVSFPAHQSSQPGLLQQVHFGVALWHIKTLFGIHTVLLYCLQASSELFMEVAGDMTPPLFLTQKLHFILWEGFIWKLFFQVYVLFAFIWQVLWHQSHVSIFITVKTHL